MHAIKLGGAKALKSNNNSIEYNIHHLHQDGTAQYCVVWAMYEKHGHKLVIAYLLIKIELELQHVQLFISSWNKDTTYIHTHAA